MNHFPQPGWHTTEQTDRYTLERFFDGERWSAPCYADDPEHIRERARFTPAEGRPDTWWPGSSTRVRSARRRAAGAVHAPVRVGMRATQSEDVH